MMLKQAPANKREVDMTPMIDCVFLLLIFFLVATDIKRNENAITVQLPKSVEALLKLIEEKPPGPLVVSILPKKPGELGLGDRPYWIFNRGCNLDELKTVLQKQAEQQYRMYGEQAIVRLRADRRATLEQLQYALKACQEARIISIYIAANKVS